MMVSTSTIGGVLRGNGYAAICRHCQATFLGTTQMESAIKLWNTRQATPRDARGET